MEKKRNLIQLVSAVLLNGYVRGFTKGKIFTGKSKLFCVPVLNCYSCPGAVCSCPIGALQAVLGNRKTQFSFYVFGFLMLFGILFGRLLCGFVCPFGFVQDLLYKIKLRKWKLPKTVNKALRYLKYVILLLFVIIFPLLLTNQYGIGNPYFCKYICSAGTLEGGIPLLLMNGELQDTIGLLYFWKISILVIIVLTSIKISRPFCKYLCPLGAFYAVFNKFSFYQMRVDKEKCTGCKACEKICTMGVKITENINSTECIRCGKCKAVCPQGAVNNSFNESISGIFK